MSTVDDVFESWEEMEESGVLDRKLQDLNVNTIADTAKSETNADPRIIILANTMRPQYPTQKPAVRILKRPDRNSLGDSGLLNGDKPKQPIKTLEQRQIEYEEKRKRIFGEERSPEDNPNNTNKITSKTSPPGGSCSTSNLPNIIRMPLGPDGTKGFHLRR